MLAAVQERREFAALGLAEFDPRKSGRRLRNRFFGDNAHNLGAFIHRDARGTTGPAQSPFRLQDQDAIRSKRLPLTDLAPSFRLAIAYNYVNAHWACSIWPRIGSFQIDLLQ
jgi:hypothetical protein